jgi:phospholipid/cholesterol/gamma-HCH transport system permease protein
MIFQIRKRVENELENYPEIREIKFDTSNVTQWDSGLLVFLVEVNRLAEKKDIKVYKDDLDNGIRRLLELASAVPEQADVGKSKKPSFWIATIGRRVEEMARDTLKIF